MDWIKVLNKHIVFEYNDLSDSEFRAWIKIMSVTAYLETIPSREQILQYVHYKTLDSFERKLNARSITLQDILNKVLKDVQDVVIAREASKERMRKYRAVRMDVTHNVTQTLPNREEKRREDIKEKPVYSPDFETFWRSYPKRSGSKKAAFDNWQKLNGSRPTIEILLESIRKQIEWREHSNGEFRPEWKDPERWLSKRMWEIDVGGNGNGKPAPVKGKPIDPADIEARQRARDAAESRSAG